MTTLTLWFQRYFFRSIMLLALAVTATAHAEPTLQEKQDTAREAARETLTELYKVQPSAQYAIEHAVGYAAFKDFGVKIFVAGGGNGAGLAVNNRTHRETFMKMLEVQAGLGFGVKQYRVVFVFETERAFDAFVNQGWDFSGQAALAAKAGSMGDAYQGAISVAPGVWVYQLTENGLAAELAVKGTKYYKDTDLQ